MTNKIPVGKLNNGKTDFYPLSVGESVVTTHDIEVTSGVGTYKKGDTIPAITTFDEIVTNIFSGANNGTDAGIEVDDNLSFTSTNPVQNKVLTTRLSNKVGKEEFQNALTTKADVFLAGIAQHFTVIIADAMSKPQYLRSIKKLAC